MLSSDYQPAGDQPTAIAELVDTARAGEKSQVLLGVTGSGKTFTMAKVSSMHVHRFVQAGSDPHQSVCREGKEQYRPHDEDCFSCRRSWEIKYRCYALTPTSR